MTNDFSIRGDTVVILVRNSRADREVLIDAADLPKVQAVPGRWCLIWHVRGYRHYVGNVYGDSTVFLHRLLGGAEADQEVRHVNGDPLDNRRSNLQACSHLESQHHRRGRPNRNGSSGILGVCLCSRTGKWIAKLTFDGRRIYVGAFADKEGAAAAVERKRAELLESVAAHGH